MKLQLDRSPPRRRGSSAQTPPDTKRRYWLGAPPREWLAPLFLPVCSAVIVAWLVHTVLQADPPRTGRWLALALGLAGGFAASLAYTARLARLNTACSSRSGARSNVSAC